MYASLPKTSSQLRWVISEPNDKALAEKKNDSFTNHWLGHQTFQVPKMEESSPILKLYGYGLCKGKPTPKIVL